MKHEWIIQGHDWPHDSEAEEKDAEDTLRAWLYGIEEKKQDAIAQALDIGNDDRDPLVLEELMQAEYFSIRRVTKFWHRVPECLGFYVSDGRRNDPTRN